MASQTEICNLTLTLLGELPITDITQDTKPARELNKLWNLRRDSCLRARLWKFAMTRTSLPASATTPAWGFSYYYDFPSDALRIVQVNDTFVGYDQSNYRTGETAEFAIEGRRIATDIAAPLKIRYVFRESDTTRWDACFVSYFAADLAEHACEAITGSSSKRADAVGAKVEALREAVRANVFETAPRHLADDSWLLARAAWG